jgi:hypothetical protein
MGHVDAKQDVIFLIGLQVAKHLIGNMDRLQLEIASVLDVASLGEHLEYGGPKPLAGRVIPLRHFGITLAAESSNSLFDNAVPNSRYCSPTTVPRKSPSSGLCFTAAANTA